MPRPLDSPSLFRILKLLTEQQLLDAGYQPGPQMIAMLSRLEEFEARGIADANYALKLLKRDFGPPPPKYAMRDSPAPCGEALKAEGRDEHENLYAVRRQMQSLLKVPVITRGAILPDACPMGGGEAVIPVGGAIAVENAIIPSAHSSDICCSMFATFYDVVAWRPSSTRSRGRPVLAPGIGTWIC